MVRGIAIIMMVGFHLLFDLEYFGLIDIPLYEGTLGLFAFSIGTLFLLVVGISLHLSYEAVRGRMDRAGIRLKYFGRGTGVFGLGLLITAFTYLAIGNGFIVFGVLHLIGLSIILAIPFLGRWELSLGAGALALAGGVILADHSYPFPWLLWLGLRPEVFYTLDYFPVLPWFGVVLIGTSLGYAFFPHRTRRFRVASSPPARPISALAFLGRYSLVIYFLHQIVIFGAIGAYVALAG